MKSRKGMGAIELILILAVVAIIAGLVWYGLYGQKKSNSADVSAANLQAENGDMRTTSFSQGTTTVKATHPVKWSVTEEKETLHDFESKAIKIKSEVGNVLQLFNSPGVGGECEPNNYTYTLTHKIPTATTGIYFTEYTTTNPGYPVKELAIEEFDEGRSARNKTLEVGDTSKDTCSMNSYSVVGDGDNANDVFVTLSTSSGSSLDGNLRAVDLSSDPDFEKMLRSLEVVK